MDKERFTSSLTPSLQRAYRYESAAYGTVAGALDDVLRLEAGDHRMRAAWSAFVDAMPQTDPKQATRTAERLLAAARSYR